MAFQITLADPDNGHFLDPDGTWSSDPDSHFEETHETEPAARAAGEKMLEKFPFAECWIENLETSDRSSFSHPHRDQYFLEKREWQAWKKLPTFMRIFARRPKCVVFKPDDES